MKVYLGGVCTALAYGLFVGGMRSTTATLASIGSLTEPLTAAILAWVLLGEQLSIFGILGALLLLSTIILLTRRTDSPAAPSTQEVDVIGGDELKRVSGALF